MATLISPCNLVIITPQRMRPAAFAAGRFKTCRFSSLAPGGARSLCPARRSVAARASNDESNKAEYNKEFGYSRKDVFIICGGLLALGYGLYYGLQAMGMEASYAGNWVQLLIFMGICVGWVSTYIFRVATKQMTYVKQLEQYEEAVMKKRIDEMTEAELSQLADEVEADRVRRAAARAVASKSD